MNDGYGLMAAEAAGLRPSLVTAVYARLLAARQEADGHWETGDERPPESYSPFALAMAALRSYGHANLRARASLLSHTAHTTEERAWQIFGICISGRDHTDADRLAGELKATQRPDGGWASLDGRSSDAYSTGQALWALHNAAGVPAFPLPIQSGGAESITCCEPRRRMVRGT
jgi:hypothetical protein